MSSSPLVNRVLRILKGLLPFALLIAIIFLSARYSGRPEEPATSLYSLGVDADWPVGKIHSRVETGLITFYPAPDADWRQLVDMSIFEGFRPDMKFRDAQEELGPPDLKGTSSLGKYWVYKRAKGEVHIAHESMGGSFFLAKWWILRAYPRPSEACAILHENVRKEIPVGQRFLTVVIMNNLHHPGASVVMDKNGCVAKIRWRNNPGSDSIAPGRKFPPRPERGTPVP